MFTYCLVWLVLGKLLHTMKKKVRIKVMMNSHVLNSKKKHVTEHRKQLEKKTELINIFFRNYENSIYKNTGGQLCNFSSVRHD